MAGCVTDVTYKRARHQNENHQNACSFFGLLLIPYSLFLILYSLLLVLYSSLLLLTPPYPPYPPYPPSFSFFLLLSPSFSFFLLLPSSYLLSVKPPYNSDMKRVSCSENVNFVR